MRNKEKLNIIGDIYNLSGLLALLVFFIVYCIQDREFLLHLMGIFITIPAFAYCTYRLIEDLKANHR